MVRGFLTRKRIRNMQYSGYDQDGEPNYDNQKVLVSMNLFFCKKDINTFWIGNKRRTWWIRLWYGTSRTELSGWIQTNARIIK